MLLNLLPGVRDLRTPLACGFLWLLTAWLIVEPHLPEKEPSGVLGSIYRLEKPFGAAGLTVALTFAAYLVGIVIPLHKWDVRQSVLGLRFLVEWKLSHGIGMRRNDEAIKDHVQRFFNQQVVADLERTTLRHRAEKAVAVLYNEEVFKRLVEKYRPSPLAGGLEEAHLRRQVEMDCVWRLLHQLTTEETALAIRLRIQDKERLFQSYDQKTAEAEFRQGVAFPLAAIATIFAVRGSLLWLVALVVPAVLYWASAQSRETARTELYEALVHGQIGSPFLDRFDEAIESGEKETLDSYASMRGFLIRKNMFE